MVYRGLFAVNGERQVLCVFRAGDLGFYALVRGLVFPRTLALSAIPGESGSENGGRFAAMMSSHFKIAGTPSNGPRRTIPGSRTSEVSVL